MPSEDLLRGHDDRKEQTMMNWSGGMGTAGWVLMSIACVILIAAVVWAVATLFGRADRPGAASIAERPEEILDRRLARGEIDTNAYDVLRKKLRAAHGKT